jgi:general secretion pathway protein N
MNKKQTVLALLAFVLVFFITAMVNAPAVWADRAIATASSGVIRIAEPEGTLWNGSGIPIIKFSALRMNDRTDDSVPGRADSGWQRLSAPVAWRLGFDLFSAQATLTIKSPELSSVSSELRIDLSPSGFYLPAGQWALDLLQFESLPGPMGLARLSGRPRASWPEIRQAWGSRLDLKSNSAVVEFSEVASALTPIRPLGDVRLTVSSSGATLLRFLVDSSPGSVLRLSAQGEWSDRLTIKGQMQCQRFCEYLVGMMETIGKKIGENYEFSHK